jgi:hypothetical protein
VIAQDLIQVIFEDMDPVWLRTMWEDGGSARADNRYFDCLSSAKV